MPARRTTIVTLTSVARRLPFAFKFYGQVYDSITICSNGWCAFGNQAWNDNFRNFSIPAMQAPQAMIAPYWQDLCTSGGGMGVWAYFQCRSHRYVIQWKAAQMSTSGGCGTQSLDFEVILYDPAFYPTDDGNGKVLVQYQAVTTTATDISRETPGFGIGIQDKRGLTGLAYYNNPATRSARGADSAPAGRFSSPPRPASCAATSAARSCDAANDQPLSDAIVSSSAPEYADTTDATGHYQLDRGAHRHSTASISPAPATTRSMLDDMPSSATAPPWSISPCSIPRWCFPTTRCSSHTITEPVTTSLHARRIPATARSMYTSAVLFGGDPHAEAPCDSVGAIAVSRRTGDCQIWGCEFAGGFWWVTGGSGPSGQNVIYKFDREGNLLGHIPQTSTSAFGWFDLAWDGQRLYGSDGALIIGIDPTGALPADTIPGPLNPCRALAYDPASDSRSGSPNTPRTSMPSTAPALSSISIANEGRGRTVDHRPRLECRRSRRLQALHLQPERPAAHASDAHQPAHRATRDVGRSARRRR